MCCVTVYTLQSRNQLMRSLCYLIAACACSTLGTIGNYGCDKKTGECRCKRFVTGRNCDKCYVCIKHYYDLNIAGLGCQSWLTSVVLLSMSLSVCLCVCLTICVCVCVCMSVCSHEFIKSTQFSFDALINEYSILLLCCLCFVSLAAVLFYDDQLSVITILCCIRFFLSLNALTSIFLEENI